MLPSPGLLKGATAGTGDWPRTAVCHVRYCICSHPPYNNNSARRRLWPAYIYRRGRSRPLAELLRWMLPSHDLLKGATRTATDCAACYVRCFFSRHSSAATTF